MPASLALKMRFSAGYAPAAIFKEHCGPVPAFGTKLVNDFNHPG